MNNGDVYGTLRRFSQVTIEIGSEEVDLRRLLHVAAKLLA